MADGRVDIPKLSIEEFEAICMPNSFSPKNIADPDWPDEVGIECMKTFSSSTIPGSRQKPSHHPPQ